MNAEYLLDAIGQLDDDLVREAERYRRPRAGHGRLLGLAASFAVVLLLGYGATHFGMGGGAPSSEKDVIPIHSDGANGAAASVRGGDMAQGGYSETNAPGAAENDNPDGAVDPNAAQEAAPSSPGGDWFTDAGSVNTETPGKPGDNSDSTIELTGGALTISVRRDGSADRHTFLFRSGESRVLDELPERCVGMGRLELPGEIEEPDIPYINSGEFAGCPVWLLMEDPETAVLYVELPQGGYLEFR